MSDPALRDFVDDAVPSPASLGRQWEQVQGRLRRRRYAQQGAIAGAVVLALGLSVWVLQRPPLLEPGQYLVATAQGERFRLADGSHVTSEGPAVVEVAQVDESEVMVWLRQGKADFDIARKPRRRFVVKAHDVEVEVVGTRFSVERLQDTVEVVVASGIVAVRRGEWSTRLTKGQRWKPEPTPVLAGEEATETDAVALPSSFRLTPLAHTDKVVVSRRQHRQRKESPQTPEPTKTPTPEAPLAEPPRAAQAETPAEALPSERAATAGDVFSRAMQARANGDTNGATKGFQQVVERWPQSAFAPMSAFEWGRLALDVRDDPRQAARAFERALELATAPALIEDTLSRLAEAYAKFDIASCRRVHSDYARRFPQGPHLKSLARACSR